MDYIITTLRPAPSMNEDRELITASSYQEAVQKAHDSWRKTHRSTYLYTHTSLTYWWHRISAQGQTQDRNTHAGVPEHQQLSRD